MSTDILSSPRLLVECVLQFVAAAFASFSSPSLISAAGTDCCFNCRAILSDHIWAMLVQHRGGGSFCGQLDIVGTFTDRRCTAKKGSPVPQN
eukprot:COSAG02_NODE_1849_length_10679_cov_7.150945_2_plen_92_part_00